MSKIVRVWRNYKDNELSDPDAEDRVHIVSWSQSKPDIVTSVNVCSTYVDEKAYELEDQKNIPLVVNSDGEVVVKVQSVPEYLKLVGKHTKARELEEARTERRKPKGKGRHRSPPPEPEPRSRALPPRPAYREIDDYDAPMADPNKPRGAAVGPNGRLLDATEIDFTEEDDSIALPPPPRHRSPSPHRRRSSSRHYQSPSPRHYPSPRRHRSPSAQQYGSRSAYHTDISERPTKRARYEEPKHNTYTRYSPTKPSHKRPRNEEEDDHPPLEAEDFGSRKTKKLPPRAYHPRPSGRPPASTSSQGSRSRRKNSNDNYKYPSQPGPSSQLYTIDDDEFSNGY